MRNDLLLIAACAGCAVALTVLLITSGGAPLERALSWMSQKAELAAVFFVQSISSQEIRSTYLGVRDSTTSRFVESTKKSVQNKSTRNEKIRILIVPGHQPNAGGTVFNGVYERDIVVDIADALADLLAQNPRYEVLVARNKETWHPMLQSYFDSHVAEIDAFKQSQALQMATHLASGRFVLEDEQVQHVTAPTSAALQLYGINKWTGENDYAITLHLHLNDYAGRRIGRVGRYDGFAVYTPDRQYSNAEASRAIGEAIAMRLAAYHATSTLPTEDQGIVEDQQLIAVGSNNSADGAALLIEYGYIYEFQFQKSSIRPLAVADYAYQTYLGLQDFFNDPVTPTFGSATLPYDWSTARAERGETGPDVYTLQAALRYLGFYPPAGKSFSDCPISGKAGPCTQTALASYQNARGLEATGTIGPKTRTALEQDLATH